MWPLTSGGRVRDHCLARTLSERCDLTLVGYHEPRLEGRLGGTQFFGKKAWTYPMPMRYTPWKLLCGLMSSAPVTVLNYRSREMRAGLTELLEQDRLRRGIEFFFMTTYST